jgi:hypothetical protein
VLASRLVCSLAPRIYRLLEPSPVALVTTARPGRVNIILEQK